METEMMEHDRDDAILWARNTLNKKNAFILDTETTGLGEEDEVVQVCVIDLDDRVILDSLVRPRCEIGEGAKQVHHIDEEMVKFAPRYAHLHECLRDILDGHTVIAYNAAFDKRILYQSKYSSDGLVKSDWECAMLQYARFVGEWDMYHGEYRWHKLQGGDHSSRGDCLSTLDLIKRMVNAQLSTEEKEGENHE
jgi:DNA polymerase-3 subunit epsilon